MKNFLLFILCLMGNSFLTFPQENPIDEEKFVDIGGIEQWVTIKGADRSNPVILFLHGGPGSPLTPYADSIFKDWEKDFVLVQWDQRGAGKTFGTYAPVELEPEFLATHPLTVEEMSRDGIELAEYLVSSLGKEKLILFGTSWGSVLGVKMASERPELFHAYLGHSQVVDPSADLIDTYTRLQAMVADAKDDEAAEILKNIGPPPYENARNTGELIRVIKKYEWMNSEPSPPWWNQIASAYNTPADNQHRADGDDYSFLHYVGDKRFGIEPMAASINLAEDNYQFEIPVYFIQGSEDLLTPMTSTKKYFEKIKAPAKEYILVPKAAHGFNASVVETVYEILNKKILPGIRE